MSAPDKWRHKDEWRRDGTGCCVIVSRHEVPLYEPHAEGPHRWCVYAYVYPAHPHFANFSGDKMFQDAATMMPMHAYPSFLQWHRAEDGKPTSVQVGADYNHLHDDRYTHFVTADDAASVFSDADMLFDWLDERKQQQAAA